MHSKGTLSLSTMKLHDVIVPETDEHIPLQPETARKEEDITL